ncbi:hypothetical protein CesoFtcFv8_002895 [Champsocephalus esox]|uniref:Secreted protein n=1 Tax=Champsocephalus esox TaxID=159716 RepID=A0AAN8D5I6_9TELE|nr:hypothetical protein CesoFtcFv8_002895 [Champsocephalus esox]
MQNLLWLYFYSSLSPSSQASSVIMHWPRLIAETKPSTERPLQISEVSGLNRRKRMSTTRVGKKIASLYTQCLRGFNQRYTEGVSV